MSQVKILHTADAHIGACENFLGARAKERQTETLLTFEKSVAAAKQADVRLYLIAGDMFDSLTAEVSYFRRFLSIVAENGDIRFVYAAGNHDPYSANNPLRMLEKPDNLYIFDTVDSCFTFDDIKTRVYGRSFKEACDKGEAAFSLVPPEDDYVNIMCIHGELTSGGGDYNPISARFIENSNMDYVALGHIHKRTDIGKLGKTRFAYCGCIEGQGFDEAGKKGVYIGTVSKTGAELEFLPLSYRTHIRTSVDISAAQDSAQAAEIITERLKGDYGEGYRENLYRITLTGEVDETAGISAKDINVRLGEVLYYVKTKDRTSPRADLELLAGEPSLKGLFVKNMLKRIAEAGDEEKPLAEYALKLGLKAFNSEVAYDEDQ